MFLSDIHIRPTNIHWNRPQNTQLDFKQNSPRLKPWSSSVTTTKTNSRQGSTLLRVHTLWPLLVSGRGVGVLQSPGHRCSLWQLWQTQNQVAEWDAITNGAGKNLPLTFCQSSVNEVMHLSLQTIDDNRQCRKKL